jgi:hypothetical protein
MRPEIEKNQYAMYKHCGLDAASFWENLTLGLGLAIIRVVCSVTMFSLELIGVKDTRTAALVFASDCSGRNWPTSVRGPRSENFAWTKKMRETRSLVIGDTILVARYSAGCHRMQNTRAYCSSVLVHSIGGLE